MEKGGVFRDRILDLRIIHHRVETFVSISQKKIKMRSEIPRSVHAFLL